MGSLNGDCGLTTFQTSMPIPKRSDFDSLDEWVDEVSSESGVSEEIIWEIVDGLKPGAAAAAKSSKSDLLGRLIEHHSKYMKLHIEKHSRVDAGCYIDLYLDGKVNYQFMYPNHNITSLNSNEKNRVRQVIQNENMEITDEGDRHITAFLNEGDVNENLRVINRILDELYDSDIDDVEQAIEIRGEERYSWTEGEVLTEEIDELSSQLSQIRQGIKTRDVQSSSEEHAEGDYDAWVFCQKCGDRIQDPDVNARFCSSCRS